MHEATDGRPAARRKGPLVYRQSAWTRATHWLWATSVFFLLVSGLQIFNAHPALYLGEELGFEYDNAVLVLGAEQTARGLRGTTTILGHTLDTTGLLGASGGVPRGFPAWATLPANQDLATGRVVHFFAAWVLAATLVVWGIASVVNGHIRNDLVPTGADIRGLPRDVASHLRGRFHHGRRYGVLQKLSYGLVIFGLFPLIVLSGLGMSPAMNAAWPWILEVFGGRQTARTVHFVAMTLFVGFFVIHIAMVLAAGPLNELRSILTGWYRADRDVPPVPGDRP